jgi:phosphatidylglycerophosphatase C
MKRIFFFDFDGTVTNKDSFLLFTFYTVGIKKLFKYWLKTTLKIIFTSIDKGKLKEQFFIDNFKNIGEKEFQNICNNFEKKYFSSIIKNSFLQYLNSLRDEDEVVIVTASVKNYLKPWCDRLKLKLISTELEVIKGKLTGNFSTPNCNYAEKVKRIKMIYNLDDFDSIYVFGDTNGDKQMMSISTNQFYKFFK